MRKVSSGTPFRGLDSDPFDHAGHECHLGKRTLIYGRNGSGKTTFSELLRAREGTGAKASVRRDGTDRTVPLADLHLEVYNRFYVAESLGEFIDGVGDAAPIGVRLGSESVASEKEATEREGHVGVLRERRGAVEARRREIEGAIEAVARKVQTAIIAELSAGDAAHYNPTRYTVKPVRQLLENDGGERLKPDELELQVAVANAAPAKSLTWAPISAAMRPTRPGEVNDTLLAVEVDTIAIPELAGDMALSDWVEDGIALHEPDDTCRFCKSGIVTQDVLDTYRQHFSKALGALRDGLNDVISECKNAAGRADAWLQGLPDESDLLPEFRQDYVIAIGACASSAAVLRARIEEIAERAGQRLADPLQPLQSEQLLPRELPAWDGASIIDILDQHNAQVVSQNAAKVAARTAVEAHFAAEHQQEYLAGRARLALADRAEEVLERAERNQAGVARRLRESMLDTTHMATELDADLKTHFGLTHLDVTASADGKGYAIVRDGEPAAWLSEGERNAIAFAYFLRTLEADEINPADTIVVIDDPASSLDKEALFAVFALAERRTKAFAQAIFLTHDYEYFRLLLNAHRSRRDKSRRLIAEDDVEEAAFPKVQVLEMVPHVVEGRTRSSHLRELPDRLVRSKSEYHYLFEKVARAALDPDSSELPLLGNAARRLIEGFISFRGPDGNDFQAKVDAVVRDADVDAILGERVVKFLHGHSHREEARPSAGLDFPAIAEELRLSMRFIKEADQQHFIRMCGAVEVPVGPLSEVC